MSAFKIAGENLNVFLFTIVIAGHQIAIEIQKVPGRQKEIHDPL